ncbi:MAG: T9SS type A sorting domain-containing protein [Chitinophagaceae bacterium]|nr:T9SS type A sorting domain-containing protein [Chitinophagaceae bacterium]
MKAFFLLVYLFISAIASYAQVNVSDSLALVNLYNATNGSGWKNKEGWLTQKVSEWNGITVTGNRVTNIYLVNNNLKGTLPSSIGDLSAITGIYLSNNKLEGSIPESVYTLSALQYFYLNNNQITGEISTKVGDLQMMIELVLDHNKLTGQLPVSLGRMARMTDLILSNNQLSGVIPKELGRTWLHDLNLSYNQFSGSLPPELATIPDLLALRLNNNSFSGSIPSGYFPLVCYIIDLSNNNLTGALPGDFGNNATVVSVNVGNNQISGQVPSSVANLTNLQSLELDSNQIQGSLPTSLGNLQKLVRLNINNNKLSGSIPPGLCNLSNLQAVNLSNNLFTFSGMECIGKKNDESIVTDYSYKNQKTLDLNNNNSILSVSADGTLSKNTYILYKEGVVVQTQNGDSTFQVSESGDYWIEVHNVEANGLVLYSSRQNVGSVILPLTWLDFTAVNCSNNVCLEWKTTNELNTAYFDVERSADGIAFEKIGNVPSANKPGEHTYNLKDYTPFYGINYYRIKQTDKDGAYTFSKIVNVNINAAGVARLTPNPANNYFVLKGILKAEKIDVFNISGQLVKQWTSVAGNQQLNISNLQPGIYIIKVIADKNETSHKLIKQ